MKMEKDWEMISLKFLHNSPLNDDEIRDWRRLRQWVYVCSRVRERVRKKRGSLARRWGKGMRKEKEKKLYIYINGGNNHRAFKMISVILDHE